MIAPWTKTRELYTRDNSTRRQRTRASWVTKRRTYITFPTFEIENTWNGASQMIRKYNFTMDNAFSILNLFSEAPEDANFCACVSWKPTSNTIVRYKLWSDVGEILWAPDYEGQTINADFSVEIWNTNNPVISGGGYTLYASTLVIPTDKCDTSDIEIGLDFSICSDITFDPTDFTPADGDYYILNGSCGGTTLIEPVEFDDDGWLIKADDNTWHLLQLIRLGGVTYTSLTPTDTPPEGTKEYLPLIDSVSGGEFDIRAFKYVNADGTVTYHPFVNSLIVDSDALGVLYSLADDGNYYGIRLRMEWDDYLLLTLSDPYSQILVDQDRAPLYLMTEEGDFLTTEDGSKLLTP